MRMDFISVSTIKAEQEQNLPYISTIVQLVPCFFLHLFKCYQPLSH